MKTVALLMLAAVFSIALGWALEKSPLLDWQRWAVLASVLFAAILLLKGTF